MSVSYPGEGRNCSYNDRNVRQYSNGQDGIVLMHMVAPCVDHLQCQPDYTRDCAARMYTTEVL